MNASRLAMICVFAALLGCGLAEYEDKMGYAKARIDYMEKVNDVLGNPLTWPENIPVPKGQRPPLVTPPREVFIRPPKGVNSLGQIKPFGPLLFRFTAAPDSGVEEMYFGASNMPLEKLKKEVSTQLGVPNTVKWQPKEVNRGPGRTPLTFEAATYEDQRRSKVYVYAVHQDPFAMVIVYKILPGSNAAAALSRMEYSLGSVAAGFAANRQHDAFPIQ